MEFSQVCVRAGVKQAQIRGGVFSDVPGHLRWDQQSRKREGHYMTVSMRNRRGLARTCVDGDDHHQGGGGEGQRGAKTYRPRSVNSLLILLSAMLRARGMRVQEASRGGEGRAEVWLWTWYAEEGCRRRWVGCVKRMTLGRRRLDCP